MKSHIDPDRDSQFALRFYSCGKHFHTGVGITGLSLNLLPWDFCVGFSFKKLLLEFFRTILLWILQDGASCPPSVSTLPWVPSSIISLVALDCATRLIENGLWTCSILNQPYLPEAVCFCQDHGADNYAGHPKRNQTRLPLAGLRT